MGRRLKHIPLWAVLPALASRDTAKRILANSRNLTPAQVAYLEDAIAQGDRVERRLREAGYYDTGPRGQLLRRTGDIAESDEEALKILKELDERDRTK